MITIVDYGLGNLGSIQNMLLRVGVESVIAGDPEIIRQADKLILPGVGHFKYAMEILHERSLVEALNERVHEARVPLLGICLGAQLLGRYSEEGGAKGLNFVPMDIVAFDKSKLRPGLKVPHMGWATTAHTDCELFAGLDDTSRFYYVHSYHMQCDDPLVAICTAEHGYRFVSGVANRNVFGVQFHPEKSHAYGQQLLKNFAGMKFAS